MKTIHGLVKDLLEEKLPSVVEGWGYEEGIKFDIDATARGKSVEEFITKTRSQSSKEQIEVCVYIPQVSYLSLERADSRSMSGTLALIVRERYRSSFAAAGAVSEALEKGGEFYTKQEGGVKYTLKTNPVGSRIELDFGADSYIVEAAFTFYITKAE